MGKIVNALLAAGMIYIAGIVGASNHYKIRHLFNELNSLKEQRKEEGIKVLANYLNFKRGIKDFGEYTLTCDSLLPITSSLDSLITDKEKELDIKHNKALSSWAYLFE